VAIPAWIRWLFAASLAVVCAFCLVRLAVLRRPKRVAGLPHWHEDLTQILMGLGMIAMFLSFAGLVPKPVWLVLFGGMAVAFAAPMLLRSAGRAQRDAQGGIVHRGPTDDHWPTVHHVMAGLAMVYMLIELGPVMDTTTALGDMPMATLPPLAAAFGIYFLGYTVWSGARLVTGRLAVAGGPELGPRLLRQPRLVEGCRTVMGLGMAYMLLAAM
jgi:hypothetical protein